jgi:anti-sigma factor RsiW
MNCDDCRKMISERAAGELSPEQTSEFDAHQQTCATCREAVLDYQRLEGLLRSSWPSEDPTAPFFVPTAEVKPNWAHTVRSWVSAASTAAVAASLLLLVIFRPSIQYDPHQLSVNFSRANSRPTTTSPVEAVSQAQVQAWVQAAFEQSMAREQTRAQFTSQPASNTPSDEESRKVAQLGVQMEMIKESQTALWQQVQQHGVYLQSAWLGSSARTAPDQNSGTNRQ